MRSKPWRLLIVGVLIGAVLLLVGFGPDGATGRRQSPGIPLPATTAEKISLADFLGKKPVVVFFYLYAFTNT